MSQSLEQKRAEYSYECVNQIKDLGFAGEFKSLVKKVPVLILTNGLGNTIAFLFSKRKSEHSALAYIIGRYMFEENEYTKKIFNNPQPQIEKKECKEGFQVSEDYFKNLLKNTIFTETDKYILATQETLRLLNWLRRFAEAMIEDNDNTNHED